MAIYGMKDASNLILFDKKTNRPALYVDYANASSSEWSAEAVYATKKGTKAIRWDASREGTLTIDTELFSLGMLAAVMGSDIETGTEGVIQRQAITLDASRKYDLGEGRNIKEDSISIVRVGEDFIDHIGAPLQNKTSDISKVPTMVNGLVVTTIDKSARLTWSSSRRADEYKVMRDDEVIATVQGTSFTDSGLTPEQTYRYTVTATNQIGDAAPSAVVEGKTGVEGTKEGTPARATKEAIEEAQKASGKLHEVNTGEATFSVEEGTITFDENAYEGENFVVYFEERVPAVRKLTISADKFPSNYSIVADAQIREQETGLDNLVQMHFKNAKPQPNFTLTQSATEPTSLSITFDLFPDKDGNLADMKIID